MHKLLKKMCTFCGENSMPGNEKMCSVPTRHKINGKRVKTTRTRYSNPTLCDCKWVLCSRKAV